MAFFLYNVTQGFLDIRYNFQQVYLTFIKEKKRKLEVEMLKAASHWGPSHHCTNLGIKVSRKTLHSAARALWSIAFWLKSQSEKLLCHSRLQGPLLKDTALAWATAKRRDLPFKASQSKGNGFCLCFSFTQLSYKVTAAPLTQRRIPSRGLHNGQSWTLWHSCGRKKKKKSIWYKFSSSCTKKWKGWSIA